MLVLLEVLREEHHSTNVVGKINFNPKMEVHKAENCMNAMKFVSSEGVKIVNIGNMDIVNGNEKLTLALLTSLMEHYHYGGRSFREQSDDLLAWIQTKIPEYALSRSLHALQMRGAAHSGSS